MNELHRYKHYAEGKKPDMKECTQCFQLCEDLEPAKLIYGGIKWKKWWCLRVSNCWGNENDRTILYFDRNVGYIDRDIVKTHQMMHLRFVHLTVHPPHSEKPINKYWSVLDKLGSSKWEDILRVMAKGS